MTTPNTRPVGRGHKLQVSLIGAVIAIALIALLNALWVTAGSRIGAFSVAAPPTSVGLAALLQTPPPTDQPFQGAPNVATYQPVGSGALYVLDSNIVPGSFLNPVSYIRVMNPTTKQETLTLAARSFPSVVLSPDGRYLYVLDLYRSKVTSGDQIDALTVHDLKQGTTVEITLPAGVRTPQLMPGATEMVLSPDGTKLFLALYRIGQGLHILTVDTKTLKVVSDAALAVECTASWVAPTNFQLVANCPEPSTGIRLTTFDPTSPNAQNRLAADMVWIAAEGDVLETAYAPAAQRYFLLTKDGLLTSVSMTGEAESATMKLELPGGMMLANNQQMKASPDGTHVFVGLRTASGNGLSDSTVFGRGSYLDQVGIFDATTGRRIALIALPEPAITISLSPDGQTLYAASPQSQRIRVVDVASAQIVDTLNNVGRTPVLVLAAP